MFIFKSTGVSIFALKSHVGAVQNEFLALFRCYANTEGGFRRLIPMIFPQIPKSTTTTCLETFDWLSQNKKYSRDIYFKGKIPLGFPFLTDILFPQNFAILTGI